MHDTGATTNNLKSGSGNNVTKTANSSENVVSGPTPMHSLIAVTSLGTRRPYPQFKPIVLNGTEKLTQIAVTKPKMGFRPVHGINNSKYHPFFSTDNCCDELRTP